MTARRLILVRHGESVWNVEHRVQGHTCRGLTDHGRAQAERTAEVLAARVGDAVVVSSDLGRCRDTAAPLAAALGIEALADATLRERDFGRWEGMTREDLERDDPARYQRWRAGEDVIAEVGGESDVVLRERAGAVFSRLLGLRGGPHDADGGATGGLSVALSEAVSEAGTIVAVTHGGTIWYGVHELLRISGYRLGTVDNASVTELVVGGRGPAGLDLAAPRMARFNETSHL
jgi:broad specificity phosphatase PhoE